MGGRRSSGKVVYPKPRAIPRKRKPGVSAGLYPDDGIFKHIFWCKGQIVFDIHTRGRRAKNLTVRQGEGLLISAIKLGILCDHDFILVIHGQNGSRMTWLNYLRTKYKNMVKRWRNNNLGVSKLYLRDLRK